MIANQRGDQIGLFEEIRQKSIQMRGRGWFLGLHRQLQQGSEFLLAGFKLAQPIYQCRVKFIFLVTSVRLKIE